MNPRAMSKRIILAQVLLAGLLACSPPVSGGGFSGRTEVKENPAAGRTYAPGQVLVKFKDGADPKTIREILAEMDLEIIKRVYQPNVYLLKIPDNASVESVVKRLQNYEAVLYSEPNYIRSID